MCQENRERKARNGGMVSGMSAAAGAVWYLPLAVTRYPTEAAEGRQGCSLMAEQSGGRSVRWPVTW